MEITYTRKGDYLYPNLALDPADDVELGKYGQMRRRYLREHREAMYWGMYVESTLTQYLLEVDETAQVQVDLTVRRLLKQYPAPDRDLYPMLHIENCKIKCLKECVYGAA